MFRALCAHRQVKIVLYSIWYHHTCRWPSRAQSSLNLCTGRPPTGVMIPQLIDLHVSTTVLFILYKVRLHVSTIHVVILGSLISLKS